MGKLGAMQDLVRGVEKLTGKSRKTDDMTQEEKQALCSVQKNQSAGKFIGLALAALLVGTFAITWTAAAFLDKGASLGSWTVLSKNGSVVDLFQCNDNGNLILLGVAFALPFACMMSWFSHGIRSGFSGWALTMAYLGACLVLTVLQCTGKTLGPVLLGAACGLWRSCLCWNDFGEPAGKEETDHAAAHFACSSDADSRNRASLRGRKEKYMKKNTVRSALIGILLLVVYHVIVFVVPFTHDGVFWTSYSFGWAAFVVLELGAYFGLGRKDDAKSKFYGFPIVRLAMIYFGVQMVLSFVAMAVSVVPVWAATVVYVILLALAALGMIGADAVVDEIHRQDTKLKKDVTFMRSLQSKVNQMATQTDVPEVRKFAEDVRYSDPVSSETLTEIERDLAAAVDELQTAIVDGDRDTILTLCRKASNVLSERNRICKLNK